MQDLIAKTADGLVPQADQALEALERYPACVLPAVAALDNPELSAEQRNALRRIVAVNLGDPDAIGRILGEDPVEFENFYPDAPNTGDSTSGTIDAFIDRYSKHGADAETAALETMIFNPTPGGGLGYQFEDEVVAQQKEAPLSEPAATAAPATDSPNDSPQPSALTESFARILIKNGNYRKALDIIEHLNLHNPEKSIYFADQIRFLRKLIINENKT